MANSGVSKSVAKKAYNNVKKDIDSLESHMNSLVTHVEEMNKNYWYGGEIANKWYKQMKGHYSTNSGSLVKFHTGVTNFQRELHEVYVKASAKGISF